MNAIAEPRLAPPGAGLLKAELLIGRLLFGFKRRSGSRDSFNAQFNREPCGAYVRVIDRAANGGTSPQPSPQRGEGGGYRRAQSVQGGTGNADRGSEHAAVKIHVGKCKGLELRDLAPEQVEALIAHWLPTAKANPKPLADDRRLMAALDWWLSMQQQPAAEPVDEDNVPY